MHAMTVTMERHTASGGSKSLWREQEPYLEGARALPGVAGRGSWGPAIYPASLSPTLPTFSCPPRPRSSGRAPAWVSAAPLNCSVVQSRAQGSEGSGEKVAATAVGGVWDCYRCCSQRYKVVLSKTLKSAARLSKPPRGSQDHELCYFTSKCYPA